jgi:hypothetical protein
MLPTVYLLNMFSTPNHCDAFLVKRISTFIEVVSLMDKRNIYSRQDNPFYDSSCGKELWQDVKMVIVVILAIPVCTDQTNPHLSRSWSQILRKRIIFVLISRVVSRRLGWVGYSSRTVTWVGNELPLLVTEFVPTGRWHERVHEPLGRQPTSNPCLLCTAINTNPWQCEVTFLKPVIHVW